MPASHAREIFQWEDRRRRRVSRGVESLATRAEWMTRSLFALYLKRTGAIAASVERRFRRLYSVELFCILQPRTPLRQCCYCL